MGLFDCKARLVRSTTFLVVVLWLGGCASTMVQNQSHGRAHTADVVKAAAVDLVTLPVQIVAMPAVAVSGYRSEAEREASRQRVRVESEQIRAVMARLEVEPEICIEEDFLSHPPDTLDNRALHLFLVKNRGRQFSDAFYEYVYRNTTAKEHESTRIWMFRNIHLPSPILLEAYDYYVTNKGTHEYPYPSRSNGQTLLEHPALPEQLLLAALEHEHESMREWAELVLEQKAREAQRTD